MKLLKNIWKLLRNECPDDHPDYEDIQRDYKWEETVENTKDAWDEWIDGSLYFIEDNDESDYSWL